MTANYEISSSMSIDELMGISSTPDNEASALAIKCLAQKGRLDRNLTLAVVRALIEIADNRPVLIQTVASTLDADFLKDGVAEQIAQEYPVALCFLAYQLLANFRLTPNRAVAIIDALGEFGEAAGTQGMVIDSLFECISAEGLIAARAVAAIRKMPKAVSARSGLWLGSREPFQKVYKFKK